MKIIESYRTVNECISRLSRLHVHLFGTHLEDMIKHFENKGVYKRTIFDVDYIIFYDQYGLLD